MRRLDAQLHAFAPSLTREVGLTPEESAKVATTVAADVRFLPPEAKARIGAASPVPLKARFEELVAFQSFMDTARMAGPDPSVTRAQLIVQNYVCFVYLKDACFEVLAGEVSPTSVAKRCATFLATGAVRDFRNAFSHANWKYTADFSGLMCWVRRDARDAASAMREFVVSQDRLEFWQCLSRGVAYAAFHHLSV
jgi:hypothetical protein